MSKLVQILDRFNRKERFCLLSDALIDPADELTKAVDTIGRPFRPLNQRFRSNLKDALELKSEIPEGSWWAFDYHLDWLFAALEIAHKCSQVEELDRKFVAPPRRQQPRDRSKVYSNDGRFKFNIEDCDLIVAYDDNIILVEAKVGFWDNSQLQSKLVGRLGRIDRNNLHYVLASPKPPVNVITDGWPKWAVTEV